MKLMNPEALSKGSSTGNEEFDNYDVKAILDDEKIELTEEE